MASLSTVAAAAVVTVAMGLQVETSHMHPVVLHAIHHAPPGPAQVELANQAPQPVTQAAPAPAPARVPPAPEKAAREKAAPCTTTGLIAGSALVQLPIRYLAAWSAMAEALGFVAVGGDEPASLREQLSGMTDRIPHPTCSH
ncbi:MAG: hypothetical protein ACJ71Z_03310 [Aeromicrobium sp.]